METSADAGASRGSKRGALRKFAHKLGLGHKSDRSRSASPAGSPRAAASPTAISATGSPAGFVSVGKPPSPLSTGGLEGSPAGTPLAPLTPSGAGVSALPSLHGAPGQQQSPLATGLTELGAGGSFRGAESPRMTSSGLESAKARLASLRETAEHAAHATTTSTTSAATAVAAPAAISTVAPTGLPVTTKATPLADKLPTGLRTVGMERQEGPMEAQEGSFKRAADVSKETRAETTSASPTTVSVTDSSVPATATTSTAAATAAASPTHLTTATAPFHTFVPVEGAIAVPVIGVPGLTRPATQPLSTPVPTSETTPLGTALLEPRTAALPAAATAPLPPPPPPPHKSLHDVRKEQMRERANSPARAPRVTVADITYTTAPPVPTAMPREVAEAAAPHMTPAITGAAITGGFGAGIGPATGGFDAGSTAVSGGAAAFPTAALAAAQLGGTPTDAQGWQQQAEAWKQVAESFKNSSSGRASPSGASTPRSVASSAGPSPLGPAGTDTASGPQSMSPSDVRRAMGMAPTGATSDHRMAVNAAVAASPPPSPRAAQELAEVAPHPAREAMGLAPLGTVTGFRAEQHAEATGPDASAPAVPIDATAGFSAEEREQMSRQEEMPAPADAKPPMGRRVSVEAMPRQPSQGEGRPRQLSLAPEPSLGPTVSAAKTPSEPLLPAGAFNREQDISVFSPGNPEMYEKKDAEVTKALEVLPPGPAATVGEESPEQVRLAPYAAGAQPEKLELGPFGSHVDASVFAPDEVHRERDVPRGPVSLDRRTESEAVVVEQLAEQVQAFNTHAAPTTPRSLHMPQHAHDASSSEGAEPPASPSMPQASDDSVTPVWQAGTGTEGVLEAEEMSHEAGDDSGTDVHAARQAEAPSPASQAANVVGESAAQAATAARETAAEAGGAIGDTAAQAGEAAKETAVEGAEQAKGMMASAATTVAETAAAAAQTVRVSVERMFAAVTGTASAAAEKASAAAEQAGEATAEAAQGAKETATAAKDVAAEKASEAGAALEDAATTTRDVAADKAGQAGEAVRSAASDVQQKADTNAEEAAQGPQQATSAGSGIASSVVGATAAAAAGTAGFVAGLVGHGSKLATGEAEVPPATEAVESTEAEASTASPVLPVAAEAHQESMKEAVSREPAVSDSLLQTVEGDPEPATLSIPPEETELPAAETHPLVTSADTHPRGTSAGSGIASSVVGGTAAVAAGAAGFVAGLVGHGSELATGEAEVPPAAPSATADTVLPVAVTTADQQPMAEAARESAGTDASLAASQDAPAAGATHFAAAEGAQPESLDATEEYLGERDATREEEGLEGRMSEVSERLQMKDLSRLEAVSSPRAADLAAGGGEYVAPKHQVAGIPSLDAAPAPPTLTDEAPQAGPGSAAAGTAAGAQPGAGGDVQEELQEWFQAEPQQEGGAGQLEEDGKRREGGDLAERTLAQQESTVSQRSIGGLREPPPSPNTAGSPAAGGAGDVPAQPASREPSRLQTSSGEVVAQEELPAVADVGLAGVAQPRDKAAHLVQNTVGWVKRNPIASVAAVAVTPATWAALTQLSVALFGPALGPLLLIGGAIALAASVVAWIVRWAGVPETELEMIQEAEAARTAVGGSAGAEQGAPAVAGDVETEERAYMNPSEPVSAESTEDLREEARGGLRDAEEAILSAVQPGGEQVGEVVQETESGGGEDEDETGEDPVGSAMHTVADAARSAAHAVEGVVDKAYHMLAREAPGADVYGEGAPVKSVPEGEREMAAQALEPAAPPAALHSAPPPTLPGANRNDSGYESAPADSEEPGPVLEGVHPIGQQTAPSATTTNMEEETTVMLEQPMLSGEAPQGLLSQAAEAGKQVAASATSALKNTAAAVTGSAAEQRSPAEQLADLRGSIVELESERAGDVEFQRASKELGM